MVKFHNEKGDIEFTPAALKVTGKISLATAIFAEDFDFLQIDRPRRTPKLTIPSPSMMHYRGGRAAIDAKLYPTWSSSGTISAASMPTKSRRSGKLGCTYLQLDDTSLAYLNDPEQREHITKLGDARREAAPDLYPASSTRRSPRSRRR